jgi:hypothetical protein
MTTCQWPTTTGTITAGTVDTERVKARVTSSSLRSWTPARAIDDEERCLVARSVLAVHVLMLSMISDGRRCS